LNGLVRPQDLLREGGNSISERRIWTNLVI
jgi:hypothetical protein